MTQKRLTGAFAQSNDSHSQRIPAVEAAGWEDPALSEICPEVEAEDQASFLSIVSTDLSDAQVQTITHPADVYPAQDSVLAIHWHPEFIPMHLILQRFDALFPARQQTLMIPTQHNNLISLDGYAGVEVDCHSQEFQTKVQILLHFRQERIDCADTLRGMIDHTFQYRSSQLFEFIDTLLDPRFETRLQQAALETSADEKVIRFVQIQTRKLKKLIETNEAVTPREWIKNKLIRDYFDSLRDRFGSFFINRAQVFLKAVKMIVKANFDLSYFYRTEEIIEEARANGAGIIVPHPEQFWPILLADYDIDGYEVWNPQSQAYTEFLIASVQRLNKTRRHAEPPLLVTMGDDCHLGEKVKRPETQDREKAMREIGVQPAWTHPAMRKCLARFNITRQGVIEEYKSRLV